MIEIPINTTNYTEGCDFIISHYFITSGHIEEKLFIKQFVNKSAPTPNGHVQYFS